MKKIYLAVFTMALLLAACGDKKSENVRLSGTLQGMADDTVYLYGTDRYYNRLDTIFVKQGKFVKDIEVDTLVSAWLQFGNGMEYPLYMDKADLIEISGSASKTGLLAVKGNPANEELTRFHQELFGKGLPSEAAVEKAAEAFIRSHPNSLASIYVLDKYFVQKSVPDFSKIKELAEQMAGSLKDRLYMEHLFEYLESYEKVSVGKTASFFQIPGIDGKDIRRIDFKDKYLLLYFWASWSDACRETSRQLKQLYKEKKNREKFDILGVSLDVDKEVWKDAVANDTLEWEQGCDLKGWNASLVGQFAVRTLPYNVLLAPSGRIEGRNLTLKEIEEKLAEIAKKK